MTRFPKPSQFKFYLKWCIREEWTLEEFDSLSIEGADSVFERSIVSQELCESNALR
jgi:hypothetical protein